MKWSPARRPQPCRSWSRILGVQVETLIGAPSPRPVQDRVQAPGCNNALERICSRLPEAQTQSGLYSEMIDSRAAAGKGQRRLRKEISAENARQRRATSIIESQLIGPYTLKPISATQTDTTSNVSSQRLQIRALTVIYNLNFSSIEYLNEKTIETGPL